MGDISEMRGLVVVGSFLAVSLLFISLIPAEFYSYEEQRTIEAPDYFESVDLAQFNSTKGLIVYDHYHEELWGKAEFGHDMCFISYFSVSAKWIANEHGYTLFGVYTGGHDMEWINKDGINRGTMLWLNELEADWNEDSEIAEYTIRCKHFYVKGFFGYNTSAYSSIEDAWDNSDLHIIFGIKWDQMGTSWNAWSTVTNILFWQPVPGIPYIISILLSIPFWIAISYMCFIFALRIIGAVFGGGGA